MDGGTKRVGLALSDPTGTVATPVRTVAAAPAETLAERLVGIALELDAGELIVGLPLRMDGGEGPEARAARALAGRLRSLTRMRVSLVDERLTSVQAERSMLAGGARRATRKQFSDQVAATLLLQSYLETKRAR